METISRAIIKRTLCSITGCVRMLDASRCAYPEREPICVEHAHEIFGFVRDEELRSTERDCPAAAAGPGILYPF